MADVDLSPYLPVNDTVSDADAISSAFQAIQAALNDIEASQFASGKILAPDKIQQDGATLGQGLVWNGTDWAPDDLAAIDVRYAKTTEKDIHTSTTETDLLNDEITIAAGAMSTNKMLRASLICDYKNDTGGAQTFPRIRVKLGASTVLDSGVGPSVAADADRRPALIEVLIPNLGAANSQWAFMRVFFPNSAALSTGTGVYGAVSGQDQEIIAGATAPTTVDTSSAQTFKVTSQHAASNASLSMRLKYARIEVV